MLLERSSRPSGWLLGVSLLLIGCRAEPPAEHLPSAEIAQVDVRDVTALPAQQTQTESEPPPPRAARPDDWFEDVTDLSGVAFVYRNGREAGACTLVESLGGGLALIDHDRDGDLDSFFTGGGTIDAASKSFSGLPGALYRNEGSWKFTEVTQASGLDAAGDYSHGAFCGDYNRDGWPDLFISCYGRSRLYRNRGDGTFAEVSQAAGVVIDGWSTAAAWADYDRDGWLDLFVAGYLDWTPAKNFDDWCGDRSRNVRDVCGPRTYAGTPARLFRNLANGTFEEVTTPAGLRRDGKGLGVVAADLNGDEWIDFYVANDATENHLYLGGKELPFREVGLAAGVAVGETGRPEASMGVDVADVDGNGLPDLWVTNFEMEDNALYLNLGGGVFSHRTATFGLGGRPRVMVGWGTGLADFDADGWPDLFVGNGHVWYATGASAFLQPAYLYRNLEGRRFSDVSAAGGPYFSTVHAARGAAVGDLDDDGCLDLVISHVNAPVRLLRNRKSAPHWIRLSLRGTASNSDAIGAVVSVPQAGRQIAQWRLGGGSYLSSGDPRLLFPAASADPVTVTVRWPTGRVERFGRREVERTHELVEGQAAPTEN